MTQPGGTVFVFQLIVMTGELFNHYAQLTLNFEL